MTIELKKAVLERLKRQGKLRRISIDEVKEHCTPESGWIAVQGLVYDITAHVKQHPGWKCGCATSELMAILRCLGKQAPAVLKSNRELFHSDSKWPFEFFYAGTDCTDEFLEIHSAHAIQRLQLFMIGELVGNKGGSGGEIFSEYKELNSTAVDSCISFSKNLCKR